MLVKMMNRLKKEEKGFTLVELLAVIVILAVIAAIAVPYILGVIDKSKKNADIATFHQIYEAARLYIASENIDVSGTADKVIKINGELIAKHYLESGLVLPSNTAMKIVNGQVIYNSGDVTTIRIGVGATTTAATASYSMTGANAKASTGTVVTDDPAVLTE